MRIAVTGASGRVGSAVVELAISRGLDVVALDRVPAQEASLATTSQLDLNDYDAVVDALAGCDALVHLAAITGPGRDPDAVVHDNNVVSSYHAMRGAVEVGIRRICQASSINAIGGRFSRTPRYEYFPLDEGHPGYAEDPYSLSKWIAEQQADAICRRHPDVSIASLRLHGVVDRRSDALPWLGLDDGAVERQLWGYTGRGPAARAFLAALAAPFEGHEVFYVVAPDTMTATPSIDLARAHYPSVPIRGDLGGTRGFFDCGKAAAILGWVHDDA